MRFLLAALLATVAGTLACDGGPRTDWQKGLARNEDADLRRMLEAGNYASVDSRITSKRFPVVERAFLEGNSKLYVYDASKRANAVLLRESGCRMSLLEEFLAYSAYHPEQPQAGEVIVTTSDSYYAGDGHFYPTLKRAEGQRHLVLERLWRQERTLYLASCPSDPGFFVR